MRDAGHGRVVSVGQEGGVAELDTTPGGVICVIAQRASSGLHALAEEIVLEVIVRARLYAAFSGDIDVEEGRSGIGALSDARPVEREGVIEADQHAEPQRGVRDVPHTLVASTHASPGRIIREVGVGTERDTGIRGPICEQLGVRGTDSHAALGRRVHQVRSRAVAVASPEVAVGEGSRGTDGNAGAIEREERWQGGALSINACQGCRVCEESRGTELQALRRSGIECIVVSDVGVLLTGGHASLGDIINVKIVGTRCLTGASGIDCEVVGRTGGHAVESCVISVERRVDGTS